MTTTQEKPILFSGPMVRAILEGRKTQDRRVINPDPKIVHAKYADGSIESARLFRNGSSRIYCPYGAPGTLLWVRETWGMAFSDHIPEGRPLTLGGQWGCPKHPEWQPCVVYKADGPIPLAPPPYETARWSPPGHMRRWASRILLEVRSVRVERLNDISTDDIWAEGVDNGASNPKMGARHDAMQRIAFGRLWDSINAKRGHSWASNPWVWVIDFERVSV